MSDYCVALEGSYFVLFVESFVLYTVLRKWPLRGRHVVALYFIITIISFGHNYSQIQLQLLIHAVTILPIRQFSAKIISLYFIAEHYESGHGPMPVFYA